MITSGIESKYQKKKKDIIETNILSLVCTYGYLYDLSCIKKKRRKNNLSVYKRFDNVMGFQIEHRNVPLYIFLKFSNALVIQDMMYICKLWVCLKTVF